MWRLARDGPSGAAQPWGRSLPLPRRFIEFYNIVFMESSRAPDGSLAPLASRNIDTGCGLERLAQILQVGRSAAPPPRRRPSGYGSAAQAGAGRNAWLLLKSAGCSRSHIWSAPPPHTGNCSMTKPA